jgi:hypothetical protein
MALPLILPAISLGLLLSGYILSGFTPLKDPMGLVLFSLVLIDTLISWPGETVQRV